MQRWAGRPIWLRSAEASVERWTPPFCGIRTSVVCWLGNQSVGSPVPRQKKRAGDGVLGCSLLQPLWDRYWGGPGRWCFRPPALGGWRGDWLVWGPQQTWWMPCRTLQAWFFVGLERLRCVCVCVCVRVICWSPVYFSVFRLPSDLPAWFWALKYSLGENEDCWHQLSLWTHHRQRTNKIATTAD